MKVEKLHNQKKGSVLMAKLEGYLYLSERQVRMISKGKLITIWRDKKRIIIGLKPKNMAERSILRQIAKLKAKLEEKTSGGKD